MKHNTIKRVVEKLLIYINNPHLNNSYKFIKFTYLSNLHQVTSIIEFNLN